MPSWGVGKPLTLSTSFSSCSSSLEHCSLVQGWIIPKGFHYFILLDLYRNSLKRTICPFYR